MFDASSIGVGAVSWSPGFHVTALPAGGLSPPASATYATTRRAAMTSDPNMTKITSFSGLDH